jgi:hypothetical protein
LFKPRGDTYDAPPLTSPPVILCEQDVTPPPDEEVVTWTESELKDFFATGGDARPEERDTSVAGGARRLTVDPRSNPENGPQKTDKSCHTAANYR